MKLSEAMDDARTCGRALRFAAITHGYKVAWVFFRNHRVKTRLRAEVNRLTARLEREQGTVVVPREVTEVLQELEMATRKFPSWPTDALHAVAVVAEEMGELQKEVLQLTYEPQKSTSCAVRKEALQLAAMAIRFLLSLDKYEWKRSEQHSQELRRLAGEGR